ncbi:MAG: hypothetical protein HOP17_13140 [Acidobacteria bacterium]|nr:hypothetical protein [Acidobacteriota bacterium]
MSVIEKVKEKLKEYPEARFQIDQDQISILPTLETGFTATIMYGGNVFFNGWHQQFVEEVDALNCFFKGLSTDYRLKECRRDDKAYQWTLEYREDGRWEKHSTSFNLNYFFVWKKKSVHYLQNDLIK